MTKTNTGSKRLISLVLNCHFFSLTTRNILFIGTKNDCPVRWGCRIHQLLLCRGVRPPTTTNECPGYDTEQSDGEVPVMLEFWEMQSTPSLPSLPDPFRPRMVAPDRVLSMGQIELNCVLRQNWIDWIRTVWLNWIAWNRNGFDY